MDGVRVGLAGAVPARGVEDAEARGLLARARKGDGDAFALWAQKDRLVVTVAGDLDADELVAAAASLRERAP